MDKIFKAFHAFAHFMGRGKRKVITVYLWPFTTLALFLLILFAVDRWLA